GDGVWVAQARLRSSRRKAGAPLLARRGKPDLELTPPFVATRVLEHRPEHLGTADVQRARVTVPAGLADATLLAWQAAARTGSVARRECIPQEPGAGGDRNGRQHARTRPANRCGPSRTGGHRRARVGTQVELADGVDETRPTFGGGSTTHAVDRSS